MKKILILALALAINSCGRELPEVYSDLDGGSAAGPCPSNIAWQTTQQLGNLFQEMHNFSKRNLNNKLGRGECTDLATAAVAGLPGIPYHRLGPTGLNADYVWGDLAGWREPNGVSRGDMRTGQILQFKNVKFEGQRGNGTYSQSAAHHTAIVASTSSDGRHVCVFHQNSGGNKTVQYGYYNFRDLKQGSVKFYTPRRS